MTAVRKVLWGLFGASVMAAAACGHKSSESHCPCVVGDGGAASTIACGGSACGTLDGVPTGFRCDVDGVHVDPTACEEDGGADGGVEEAGTVDAPSGHDAGTPYDASLLPDGAGPPGKCAAGDGGGTCSAPNTCSCGTASSCTLACGAGSANAGFELECGQFRSCDLSCATACQISCLQSQACNFVVGAGSQVTCTQAVSCQGTIGSGGTVDCQQAQACALQCTGPCTVNCAGTSSCRVTCPADAGACDVTCPSGAATLCPDGVTKVCDPSGC
jgi:hypothetical protein